MFVHVGSSPTRDTWGLYDNAQTSSYSSDTMPIRGWRLNYFCVRWRTLLWNFWRLLDTDSRPYSGRPRKLVLFRPQPANNRVADRIYFAVQVGMWPRILAIPLPMDWRPKFDLRHRNQTGSSRRCWADVISTPLPNKSPIISMMVGFLCVWPTREAEFPNRIGP